MPSASGRCRDLCTSKPPKPTRTAATALTSSTGRPFTAPTTLPMLACWSLCSPSISSRARPSMATRGCRSACRATVPIPPLEARSPRRALTHHAFPHGPLQSRPQSYGCCPLSLCKRNENKDASLLSNTQRKYSHTRKKKNGNSFFSTR